MTEADDEIRPSGPSRLRLAHELDRPTAAGIYDRLLGGTCHTAQERAAAELLQEIAPEVALGALANRAFHQRSAAWIASQGGRQFVDLGCGLPTQENTHDVVHRVAADARVVYVDHDPQVADRSKRLLAEVPGTAFVTADLRQPTSVLDHSALRGLLDLRKPVAVMATAVLHLIADEDDPWSLVDQLMSALAPGSFLALSHGTADHYDPHQTKLVKEIYRGADSQYHPRSKTEVGRFFAGLEVVPPYPGARAEVTYGGLWGADDPELAGDASDRWFYAGVARKPNAAATEESRDPFEGWVLTFHDDPAPNATSTEPNG